MTGTQILLVKNSWKLLRNLDHILIGDVFYGKLFVDAPHLKHLFKHPLEVQSKKLIDMLNFIVSHLDNIEKLNEEIGQLSIRHIKYGVQAIHYDAVGNALLWTLKHGLGRDWNEDVKEAWAICYQNLSMAMKNASR